MEKVKIVRKNGDGYTEEWIESLFPEKAGAVGTEKKAPRCRFGPDGALRPAAEQMQGIVEQTIQREG